MPDQKATTDAQGLTARELAEQGLEVAEEGDLAEGRRLAAEARKLDPKAAEAVLRETEQDKEAATKFAARD